MSEEEKERFVKKRFTELLKEEVSKIDIIWTFIQHEALLIEDHEKEIQKILSEFVENLKFFIDCDRCFEVANRLIEEYEEGSK